MDVAWHTVALLTYRVGRRCIMPNPAQSACHVPLVSAMLAGVSGIASFWLEEPHSSSQGKLRSHLASHTKFGLCLLKCSICVNEKSLRESALWHAAPSPPPPDIPDIRAHSHARSVTQLHERSFWGRFGLVSLRLSHFHPLFSSTCVLLFLSHFGFVAFPVGHQ